MSRRNMEEALTRFNGALDGLATAVEARRTNEDRLSSLESDLHLMALDRAQLARRLDEALAKGKDTEQLSARLDAVIADIDSLIEQAEAA